MGTAGQEEPIPAGEWAGHGQQVMRNCIVHHLSFLSFHFILLSFLNTSSSSSSVITIIIIL